MSAKLIQNPDGANFQARAVLEMVRYLLGGEGSGIEASWDDEWKRYIADPQLARFDNCREQGYVIYMRSRNYDKQINVTFYEHRNSDGLCVQVNDVKTFNAPQLSDIVGTWADKWDVTHPFQFGEITAAAKCIVKILEDFWKETTVAPKTKELAV